MDHGGTLSNAFSMNIIINFKDRSMAIAVNDSNFEEVVLKAEVPVLVDFWAEWCGPCKMLSPIIAEIAEEHPEIKVCKVNVDEEMELASAFQIVSIPTVLAMENGEIKNKSIGLKSKEHLLSMF